MDNPQTSAIWEHKTQNEDKQNTTKQKQSIQKIKNMSNTDPTKKCMYLRIKLKTLDPCKISISVTVTCDARNVYDNVICDHGCLLANTISDIQYQKWFVNRKIIHLRVKKKSARHLKSVKKNNRKLLPNHIDSFINAFPDRFVVQRLWVLVCIEVQVTSSNRRFLCLTIDEYSCDWLESHH